MKTVVLIAAKETVLDPNTAQNVTTVFTTIDLLKTSINQKPKDGFDVVEMMYRLKILGLLEPFEKQFQKPVFKTIDEVPADFLAQTATLELEDADFEKLKPIVKEMKWGILSQSIVDFINLFN